MLLKDRTGQQTGWQTGCFLPKSSYLIEKFLILQDTNSKYNDLCQQPQLQFEFGSNKYKEEAMFDPKTLVDIEVGTVD